MKKLVFATGFLIILVLAAGLGLSGQVTYPNWMNINSTMCYLGQSCSISASGPPSGTAGGVLSGTYPNPGYAVQPLVPANNLSDVGTAATALSNLGGAPLASPTFTGTVTIPTGASITAPTLSGTTVIGSSAGPYWKLVPDASFPALKMFSAGSTQVDALQTDANGNIFIDYLGNGATGAVTFRNAIGGGHVTALTLTAAGGVTMGGLTNAATGDYVCYNAGVIEFNTATCTLSLRKYKQNIHTLNASLAEVMALKPVAYRYKPEMKLGDKMQVGFIADDVAKLDPRIAVYKDNGELESVDYEHMTALLTAAIQEQQKEIAALKKQVAKLGSSH